MTQRKFSVYVAGPITKGDQFQNTSKACHVGQTLHELGLVPYIPHWGAMQQFHYAWTHEEWLKYDFFWLAKCDALLRMEGESPGADAEVAFANKNSIPVFHSVTTLTASLLRRDE